MAVDCMRLFRSFVLCFYGVVLLNIGKSFTDEVKEDALPLKDIGVMILSQNNTYHYERAQRLYKDIQLQLAHLPKSQWPEITFSHENYKSVGHWTLFPILRELAWTYNKHKWLFICEEETRVELVGLSKVLKEYGHKEHYFLGKPLYDANPVIQHHYNADKDFAYPDFSAGFLFSVSFLKSFASKWPLPKFNADFTIDPKHELAKAVELLGVKLTEVPELCTERKTTKCVTYYPIRFPSCGPLISEDDLYVGVKTCEKYHTSRLQVVKDTWAKQAQHIEFISETEDPSIPTISLGIPNTERGHCGKTYAILERFYKDPWYPSWLLIADDDTIINLKLLRKLLSCYNPSEPVALGEKYGYSVAKGNGYDYITGGGGMVFSRQAVAMLVSSEKCSCPKIESPDDMILGMCLKRLQIPISHSPYFHQTRLVDYPEEFLRPKLHISFHKHWNNDPYEVYRAITDIEDKINLKQTAKRKMKRDEL